MPSLKKLTTSVATTLRYACVAFTLLLPLRGETKPERTDREPAEITVLPRYTVLSEFLTITFSRNMGGSLTGAEVTWVAKNSVVEKRGVQVYDELISINGVKIAGQNYTDMHDLLERELQPGESIRLLFSGRRGALGRRMNYVFVIERPRTDR